MRLLRNVSDAAGNSRVAVGVLEDIRELVHALVRETRRYPVCGVDVQATGPDGEVVCAGQRLRIPPGETIAVELRPQIPITHIRFAAYGPCTVTACLVGNRTYWFDTGDMTSGLFNCRADPGVCISFRLRVPS